MRIFWVTWVLVAAVSMRLAADLTFIAFKLHPEVSPGIAGMFLSPYLGRFGASDLFELTNLALEIVDIVMVEGLYRVWCNLKRLRPLAESAA